MLHSGSTMVHIYSEEYIHIPMISKFMTWFGEIDDVCLVQSDYSPPCYTIEVKFKTQAGSDQLLLWPHPLFIDGKRVTLSRNNHHDDIPTLGTLGSQSTVSRVAAQKTSCLSVYGIPETWKGYDLFKALDKLFPNLIVAAFVSIDGIEGYKRGLVEFRNSLVALELMMASSIESNGTKLFFLDNDTSNIQSLHPETLIEFDVFPFLPTCWDGTLISIPVHE